jgi:hypothetical protein
MRTLLYSILVLMLAFTGCKPSQLSSGKGSQGGKYHEDLSALRPSVDDVEPGDTTGIEVRQRDPKVYVEPKFTVNKQLDAVLDSIDRINLTRKFIDGYSIQVYSGLNREEALTVKKDLLTYAPELEAEVYYNQPNFRVKVGRYVTQLQAQKDFQLVKKYFPSAIVVPDRISIN